MLKRIIAMISVFVLCLSAFSGCATQSNTDKATEENKVYTSADYTAEQLDSSVYDVDKYASPFWKGNIVYNELIFPMYNENAEIPPFQLMYNVDEIVSVRDYSLNKTYIEGKDYKLEDGKLVILPEGDIEISGYSLIHRTGVPDIMPDDLLATLDGKGTEYLDVHNKLIKKTIAVTYIHNDTWDYFTPQHYKKSFKRTISKMKKGKETTIVVTGDSVSVGYSSSKMVDLSPYADAYVDMTSKYLQNYYNNENIKFINSSVGGATAEIDEEKLLNEVIGYKPSMVIIALGTNDAMAGRTTEEYISDIEGRIEFIKKHLSKCDFIIVTPHLSNSKIFDITYYKEYREALYQLSEKWKNVEICDPLAIEMDLMEKADKDFVSFTIDNLVHKNDYGMRIIAQTIISALAE